VLFRSGFVKKVQFVKYSRELLLISSDRLGTLDESFEAGTLRPTHTIPPCPLLFVAVDHWQPVFDLILRCLIGETHSTLIG
jgi:predicted Rossmann-fold nucleotide-binding protein